MINETERLFINSTKAVNSMPQDDKLIGEVPIKEYINFDSPGWCDFLYIESTAAFEIHVDLTNCTETKVKNNYCSTAYGDSVDEVIKMFIAQLSLRAAEQLTAVKAGHERLIFQSRTPVYLYEQPNGKIKLRWRGKLDRIPSEPKTRPERVPMSAYGKSIIIKDIDILAPAPKPFAKWAEMFDQSIIEISTEFSIW